MDTKTLLDKAGRSIGRRRLLERFGQAALGGAVIIAGLPPAKFVDAAKGCCKGDCVNGCCTHCDYNTLRYRYCCELGFQDTCPDLSCFTGDHQWWVWSCCYSPQVVACYECCDFCCSKAVVQSTCHCGSAEAGRLVEAESALSQLSQC